MKSWLVAGLALAGLLTAAAVVFTIRGAVALLFGWAFFLVRVVPRLTVDGPTVAVGGAAIVVFVLIFHGVARTYGTASPGADALGRRWRIRSTTIVVSVLFILFAAGISLVGVVHQLAWLGGSDKPLLVEGLAYQPHPINNLKTMGIAIGNYSSENQDRLPPGGTFSDDGRMLHSWETLLLPGMGCQTNGIDLNQPWNDPVNDRYFHDVIPPFINQSLGSPPLEDSEGYGLSHYAANSRVMNGSPAMKFSDITDGTSNTLLIGEVNADFKPWGHPVNWRDPATGINRSPNGFGGPTGAGGALFLMADGSVRFVSERINPAALRALSTPRGGDEAGVEGWEPR